MHDINPLYCNRIAGQFLNKWFPSGKWINRTEPIACPFSANLDLLYFYLYNYLRTILYRTSLENAEIFIYYRIVYILYTRLYIVERCKYIRRNSENFKTMKGSLIWFKDLY